LHVAKEKEKPQEDIYGGMSMRYSQIRNLDISNGLGVGVSLFVQGCPFHCKNCFNSDTWDFNGGKEWTEEIKDRFIKLIDRPYIKRISFLGGECLAEQNLDEVLKLVQEIRISFPDKTIWLYTGYSYSEIFRGQSSCLSQEGLNNFKRREIIKLCDVVVDGEYIDEQKDLSLKWRGSKNQHVIDVKQSLAQNKMVLYCD
jgi:anaerobic ribonucleoside-triphosphate reductase activating protein